GLWHRGENTVAAGDERFEAWVDPSVGKQIDLTVKRSLEVLEMGVATHWKGFSRVRGTIEALPDDNSLQDMTDANSYCRKTRCCQSSSTCFTCSSLPRSRQ